MKTIRAMAFFAIFTVFSAALSMGADASAEAAGWESYQLIDHILNIPEPGMPEFFEDSVIFTASSDLRRVGVAFAHENFSKVHWFMQLLVPQNPIGAPIPPGKKFPDPYINSGIQFFVYQIPENVKELEYRLVVNGLWTVDPANAKVRRNQVSGLVCSVLSLPPGKSKSDSPVISFEGLNFTFNGPPGEIVTVAGDFNGWDPFMYELKEAPAGIYSIRIPLPPGKYQYVFFHKGQRYVDPNNPRRIYSRDGSAASEIVVP